MAQIQAAKRVHNHKMFKRYQIAHFEIFPDQRLVHANGAAVALGARAFDLLLCLIENRDRVIPKDELMAKTWPGLVVEEGNLNVQVHALRKLLGSAAVVTVPGRGFRLAVEVKELAATAVAAPAPAADAGRVASPSPRVVRTRSQDLPPVASAASSSLADSPVQIDLSLPNKPSIAVLPFDNMSASPGQDYFCDGVSEDLITELARFQNLFVIARNSSFSYKGKSTKIQQIGKELGVRYVLEGSVRRDGQRIRVAAQLVDAQSGHHVWAERYDRVLEDVFAVQEELVQAIVATVAPQVDAAESMQVRQRPASVTAYDIAVRASALVNAAYMKSSVKEALEGLALAHTALDIDPDSQLALNAVSFAHYQQLTNHTAADRVAAFDEGLAAANRGIALSQHGWSHCYKALLLSIAPEGPRWDEARREAETACRLNPQDCFAMGVCGYIRSQTGNAVGGISMLERSLRINPRDPNAYRTFNILAIANFVAGNYEKSVEWSRHATSCGPEYAFGYLILASSSVAMGDLIAATAALQSAQRLAPALSAAFLNVASVNLEPSFAQRHTVFLRIAAGLEDVTAAQALR